MLRAPRLRWRWFAAGLRSEAESNAGLPLAILDNSGIPSQLKGYVSVAVSTGLLTGGQVFRPQDTLTRGELAHAISVLQRRAIATQ